MPVEKLAASAATASLQSAQVSLPTATGGFGTSLIPAAAHCGICGPERAQSSSQSFQHPAASEGHCRYVPLLSIRLAHMRAHMARSGPAVPAGSQPLDLRELPRRGVDAVPQAAVLSAQTSSGPCLSALRSTILRYEHHARHRRSGKWVSSRKADPKSRDDAAKTGARTAHGYRRRQCTSARNVLLRYVKGTSARSILPMSNKVIFESRSSEREDTRCADSGTCVEAVQHVQ